jgi:hypothetical protein
LHWPIELAKSISLAFMKLITTKSILFAWFKTAFAAWIILCVICGSYILIDSGGRFGADLWFILAVSSAIHLASFFLVGLPFFAHFWTRKESRVWDLRISLPMGAILGFLTIWITFSTIGARVINPFSSDGAIGCLVGAGYGFVTAFVAWVVRKIEV